MAAIVCADFVTDPAPPIPKRVTCTHRTCLANRWANFVFSMDLSPDQKDEAGAGVGAWSLWDIPCSNACQIDDDRGEDLICLAVLNRVYWLDWDRYRDEFAWNAFTPINRRIRLGPIPSTQQAVDGQYRSTLKGYDLSKLKRFREFQWSLEDGSTRAPGAFWTVTVGEWNNEDNTSRSTVRRTDGRMRAKVVTKGRTFVVTLEHSANEPVRIEHWEAMWDVLGPRIRESGTRGSTI